MSESIAVSIIMPAYNRADWLPISVGSVLQQTYHDWELLIVDDGSTDATRDVANHFANEDPRIRCLTNTHRKGPSGARNEGLDAARGKYTAYLDSDDEWEPFHLERMIYYLSTYADRIDIMTANPLRRFRETGEVFNFDQMNLDAIEYERIEDGYLIDPAAACRVILDQRVLTTQTIVGKREVISSVNWNENLPAATDCLYCTELVFSGFRICHLQDYHLTYWAHRDNLTNCGGQHDPQRMISVHQGFIEHIKILMQHESITKRQRRKLASRLANYYVWQLGYNCYLTLGNFSKARSMIFHGIRIQPWNIRYWKTFVGSFVKQLIYRRKEV